MRKEQDVQQKEAEEKLTVKWVLCLQRERDAILDRERRNVHERQSVGGTNNKKSESRERLEATENIVPVNGHVDVGGVRY